MANSQNKTTPYPLYEGTFSVGLDKKFNRIGREDPPAKGALKIALNPFLIRSDDKKILFDVGIGDFGEDTSTEIIKENLADHGLTEYDITDIFASHLHYDHIGGLAGRPSRSEERRVGKEGGPRRSRESERRRIMLRDARA